MLHKYNWPPNQGGGKDCIMLKTITYTVSIENSMIEELTYPQWQAFGYILQEEVMQGLNF